MMPWWPSAWIRACLENHGFHFWVLNPVRVGQLLQLQNSVFSVNSELSSTTNIVCPDKAVESSSKSHSIQHYQSVPYLMLEEKQLFLYIGHIYLPGLKVISHKVFRMPGIEVFIEVSAYIVPYIECVKAHTGNT